MKRTVAWVVRGGEQTHSELASQSAAIQLLQQQVASLGEVLTRVDPLASQAAGLPEQLRAVADDLAERVSSATVRLDVLESRLDHLDEAIAELVRLVAPDGD
ncbi:MAG: hypothetical protein KDB37_01220 [Ilumatobacter sp.]|nr:hypothetical protein [Ilumatobacter sp.]